MKGCDDLHSCRLLNSAPGDLASFDPLKDELLWEKTLQIFYYLASGAFFLFKVEKLSRCDDRLKTFFCVFCFFLIRSF